MEPVLTQEELEAIYNAMQSDVGPQTHVDDYVLASDHAFNMRCLKHWGETAKQVVPALENMFVRRLAVRGRVEVQDLRAIEDERENSRVTDGGGLTNVMPLAQTDPGSEVRVISIGGNKILLGIERGCAARYIARRTGIASNDGAGSASLTVLELRLLVDFFEELADVMRTRLGKYGEIRVESDEPEDFWLGRMPRGAWINVRFASQSTPEVSFWLRGPAALFLPEHEVDSARLAARMTSAKVELVMELGRLSLKAFDLWKMKPGDVYQMGVAMDEPLDIHVGGIYKLKGVPTVSRGHVAFEMLEPKKSV